MKNNNLSKLNIKDIIAKLSSLDKEEISKSELDQMLLDGFFPTVTTIEEIEDKSKCYGHQHLRIGELKDKIKDLPDDALVFVERVEDFYFEEMNWSVILKKGDSYFNSLKFNELFTNYLSNPEIAKDYPNITKEYALEHIISEEQLEKNKDQFMIVSNNSNGKNKNDKELYKDALYLYIHY